jgi:phospholipid-binding lipoprotein MlaA
MDTKMKLPTLLSRTVILAASCICMNALNVQAAPAHDPIEPVNRVIFRFNEYADMIVLKPVAQAYDYVIPAQGKRAVSNVLHNLTMPVTFVNSVLQGDPQNSFEALWSFILNSTFGIAGIFDFAGTNTDLDVQDEDFGQTLGVWGVGSGPYLVLPLMGSSNLRDAGGMGVDYFTDPYNYLESDVAVYGRMGIEVVNARYQTLKLVDEVYKNSLDPYATFRSGYQQRRDAQISNTKSNDINED